MSKTDKDKLVAYRINRSKETFKEVKSLVDLEYWNTCINRLYYACFYAIGALLVKNEIAAKSHAGVRQMFGLHFIKTGLASKENGKLFSDLFDRRQQGDYTDFFEFDEATVLSFYYTC